MKRIHLTLFIGILMALCMSVSTLSLAQTVGSWQVYPSYQNATRNVTDGTMVYSLCDGNLFRYDTEDESVKTYDCLNDLNGVHINYIDYSTTAKRLVVVYDDENIDLIDADDNIFNITALKDKILTGKDVTSIYVDGADAYLTTGFGFVVIDVKEGVVLDTYQLGYAVKGLTMKNGKVYVATSSEVLAAAKTANWHEKSNWTSSTDLERWQIILQNPEYNLAGGLYWHSDGTNGLNGYKKQQDGTYVKAAGPIQPNSPRHDLFYRMHYDTDASGNYRLLVAGGINTPFSIFNPATAMLYDGTTWSHLDDTTYVKSYPDLKHYNMTDIVQDPNDPTHIFASPYRTGLYEYKNNKFVKLYNSDNSPLRSILPKNNEYYNYVSATCLQYDTDGKLWMCNQETDTIIRYMMPNGNWGKLYFSEIASTPQCDNFLFSSSGVYFLVARRMDGRGFFGFTPDGKKHMLRQTITNEEKTTYSPDEFYCMTEDLDGKIWCGTISGLFVIDTPANFFNSGFQFNQIKIARNDGSGLADYLLNGVSVTCITVDGGNRKWVGTKGNGVYLISADGQTMLQHFTADDTPLLSDDIQCIAVNPKTGLVMIGTDVGLCSYMGDATEAQDELSKDNVIAYPNPVRPDYTGQIRIEGLTYGAEVKICSSTGQLIWSGTSNGGTATWNGCNKSGKRVSSGVYQVISNTDDGKKAVVCRIIVIK